MYCTLKPLLVVRRSPRCGCGLPRCQFSTQLLRFVEVVALVALQYRSSANRGRYTVRLRVEEAGLAVAVVVVVRPGQVYGDVHARKRVVEANAHVEAAVGR
jgi:hypothetical protein